MSEVDLCTCTHSKYGHYWDRLIRRYRCRAKKCECSMPEYTVKHKIYAT